MCGTCECKTRENPAEIYNGKYCECDNFNCDRSGNKLCGGEDGAGGVNVMGGGGWMEVDRWMDGWMDGGR